ncbi:apelin receptor B-like [Scleropages formosus]|uniref:Apelin receptor B-like n=2 Tax=Scleropages formosus TaxID=113540 RepID=A0A0P7VE82_SCLFO|nr:apelin receptor B-like [Scleropages formosus]
MSFPSPSPSPSTPPLETCDYSEWGATWVLIPAIYILAFTLGSLGNGLVLWVYLERPHSRRSCIKPQLPTICTHPVRSAPSRSLTDSLIASLAAADLAFVVTLPLWAAYTALGFHWPFGKFFCKASSYLVAVNMYASVFSLAGLSVERYWVIAGRLQAHRARGSRSRILWIVGGVWVVASILALPALLLRTVMEVEVVARPGDALEEAGESGPPKGNASYRLVSCEMDYSILISTDLPEDREWAELLWTAAMGIKSTLLGFLLPLTILLLCYCSLGHLLSQHFGRGPWADRRRQRRLLRVIITLVLAFFLCWLPFHVNKTLSILTELELLPYSCSFDRALLVAHPYTTCLGYVNSCLNPLLYACCDAGFRRRCRALLNSCCRKGARDSDNEEPSRSSAVPSGTNDGTGNGGSDARGNREHRSQ